MERRITSIKQSEITETWYLVDATGQRIGKIAGVVAELLLGKNDPKTRPNLDPRVKVVIINSDKLDIPPKKGFSKFYRSYSGFPGGLKVITLDALMAKDSTKVLQNAIKGMLPRNKRGAHILAQNLKVFKSNEHLHEAQKPEVINLNNFRV